MRRSRPSDRPGRSRIRTVLAALVVLGLAAALASRVTFGLFTDPAATSPRIEAAQIDISITTPGGPPVPFSGTGFYPGSSVSQDVALKNEGGAPLGSLRLSSSATSSNLLTTDPTNGLQLTLTNCNRRWTEHATPSGPTFTCDDGSARTVYGGPFLTDRPLPELGALTTTAQLLITVSLPASADNRFQGLSASLGLAFRGQQVTGTVR